MNDRAGEFVELYSRHQSKLLRYVVALVANIDDAEDVMQETSRVLWERFDDFEPGTNFLAWARKVAMLRVMEYRRNPSRRERLLPDETLECIARHWEEDERAGVLAERHAAVQACVAELGETDRQLLQERYVLNRRVRQIAEQSQRTVNAVSKSFERMRRFLFECVSRRLAAMGRKSRS